MKSLIPLAKVIGGIQNSVNYQARTFFLDITKCSWTEGPALQTGVNATKPFPLSLKLI
jgi:hypothetical protein